MPYADGAAAQTGPNEAAKGRIRPIKAYPALWSIVLVVIGYPRSGGIHPVSNIEGIYSTSAVCTCVCLFFGVTMAELSEARKRSGVPKDGKRNKHEGN